MFTELPGLFCIANNEGGNMSHEYSANKNKQQKQPETFFQQYLLNLDELSNDWAVDVEDVMLETNTHTIRHYIRDTAQGIRKHFN